MEENNGLEGKISYPDINYSRHQFFCYFFQGGNHGCHYLEVFLEKSSFISTSHEFGHIIIFAKISLVRRRRKFQLNVILMYHKDGLVVIYLLI